MLSICSWTSLPALPFGAMVIPACKYRTQSVWNRKRPIKITVFNSLLLTEPPKTKPKSNHLLSGEPFPNVQPELSWCSFNPFSCAHDLDFSIEPCSRFAQSLRERIVFHHWIVHHQREQKMNKGQKIEVYWEQTGGTGSFLENNILPFGFFGPAIRSVLLEQQICFIGSGEISPYHKWAHKHTHTAVAVLEKSEMQEANQDNEEHLPRRLVLAWWPCQPAKIQALLINNSFCRWTSPGQSCWQLSYLFLLGAKPALHLHQMKAADPAGSKIYCEL